MGDNQEWSKFSNSDRATQVPFIISMPQFGLRYNNFTQPKNMKQYFSDYISKQLNEYQTNKPLKIERTYNGMVELLDVFPTLVDLVGLKKIPSCLWNSSALVCTEGLSQSCYIYSVINGTNPKLTCKSKPAAISQYPRPTLFPSVDPDSDQCRLIEAKIMGYSIRSRRYRYTLWLPFHSHNFTADWNNPLSEELYDHKVDQYEHFNLLRNKPYVALSLYKYARKILDNI